MDSSAWSATVPHHDASSPAAGRAMAGEVPLPLWWAFAIPLCLFVASIATVSYTPGRFVISKYLGLATAAVFALGFVLRMLPLTFAAFWWFAFAGWMALGGALVSRLYDLTLTDAVTMAQLTVLAVMVAGFATNPQRGRFIAWALAISSLFPLFGRALGIAGLAELANVDTRGAEEAGQFTGTVGQPNLLATLLVYGGMASTLVFVTAGRVGKVVAVGVLLVQFAGLISTGSRGGFLVFCFFLAVSFGLHYLRHLGQRLYGAIAVLVLIGLVLYIALPYIEDSGLGRRLGTTFGFVTGSAGREESGSERLMLIRESARIFFGNPVIGIGMSNFEHVSGTGMYPHNNYGVILAETGLVGAILYFTPLLWVVARLAPMARRASDGLPYQAYCLQLLACLAGFFAYGMFQGNWRSKSAVCIIGMAFGALIMLNRMRNRAAPDGPDVDAARGYEAYA